MAIEFVDKKEVAFAREEIEKVIHNVQNYLRKQGIMTFQYNLVGSASNKRHLVTRIVGGNKGFDLDFNIQVKKISDEYDEAKKTKLILIDAFNKFLPAAYTRCEDSSTVFTIKKVDKKSKKILYGYDFAIVNYFEEEFENPDFDAEYDDPDDETYFIERQEFIKFNKQQNKYVWELRKIASDHRYMEQFIKDNGLWNELRTAYLYNKNRQPDEKSRIIYYQTLNQIYQKHS